MKFQTIQDFSCEEKIKTYLVNRNNKDYLNIDKDRKFIFSKEKKENLFLSTLDGNTGIIHNNIDLLSIVKIEDAPEINKKKYTIKDIRNECFYSSKPLSESITFSSFIADRKDAKAWEFFEIEEYNIDVCKNITDTLNALPKNFKNTIDLYWWRPKSGINLGDELNPYVFSHFTKNRIRRVDNVNETSVLGIGSIISWVKKNEKKYKVWGSGAMFPKSLDTSTYDVRLLRGPLTASLLDLKTNVPYGDPGLLSSTIWKPSEKKKYKWGLCVHLAHQKKEWVKKILEDKENTVFLDLNDPDIETVMRKFSECENIASTSLHGLIIADSYEIPNLWIWDGNLHPGGQWKFFDYFAGVGRDYIDNVSPASIKELIKINISGKFSYFNKLDKVKDRIISSFPQDL